MIKCILENLSEKNNIYDTFNNHVNGIVFINIDVNYYINIHTIAYCFTNQIFNINLILEI
jgi:hypothetical protein